LLVGAFASEIAIRLLIVPPEPSVLTRCPNRRRTGLPPSANASARSLQFSRGGARSAGGGAAYCAPCLGRGPLALEVTTGGPARSPSARGSSTSRIWRGRPSRGSRSGASCRLRCTAAPPARPQRVRRHDLRG